MCECWQERWASCFRARRFDQPCPIALLIASESILRSFYSSLRLTLHTSTSRAFFLLLVLDGILIQTLQGVHLLVADKVSVLWVAFFMVVLPVPLACPHGGVRLLLCS
jgi:hypothetical protein